MVPASCRTATPLEGPTAPNAAPVASIVLRVQSVVPLSSIQPALGVPSDQPFRASMTPANSCGSIVVGAMEPTTFAPDASVRVAVAVSHTWPRVVWPTQPATCRWSTLAMIPSNAKREPSGIAVHGAAAFTAPVSENAPLVAAAAAGGAVSAADPIDSGTTPAPRQTTKSVRRVVVDRCR